MGMDMDVDQAKSVNVATDLSGRYCDPIASSVRSQLRIDTTPMRRKVLEHLYRYNPLHYAVDGGEDSDG
jgi:hypothetical protein